MTCVPPTVGGLNAIVSGNAGFAIKVASKTLAAPAGAVMGPGDGFGTLGDVPWVVG